MNYFPKSDEKGQRRFSLRRCPEINEPQPKPAKELKMQYIATSGQSLSNHNNHTNASRIWPVWAGSIKSPVIFAPMTKKAAIAIWHKARLWERSSRTQGKHGGCLGRSALAVLHSLLFDFLNYRTGRLDPSIERLAAMAGVCERTCRTALAILKASGILGWLRRCSHHHTEDGKFALKQDTNAYQIAPTAQWGPADPKPPPIPERDTLGYPPAFAGPLDLAAADLCGGNYLSARATLESDPRDPLAQALAALGKAMGRF